MNLFDVERMVWEQDRVRIAFTRPDTQLTFNHSYLEANPEGVGQEVDIYVLVERIVSTVGFGVPFLVLSGVEQPVLCNSDSPNEYLN